MGKRKDLTGKVFGKLTVLQETEVRSGSGSIMWECVCECGVSRLLPTNTLNYGSTKSCGSCSKISHGLSCHPLYNVYMHMMHRCHNKGDRQYVSYGGRGIKVCKRWRDNVQTFIDWGEANGYNSELQIDRIDNDKGYYPGNCRFVTAKINSNNRRSTAQAVLNSGRKMPLTEFYEKNVNKAMVSYSTFFSRYVNCGWSLRKSLTKLPRSVQPSKR